MQTSIRAAALTLLALSTAHAQPGTGGFTYGDLYLHTTAWSGISSADGAVVRIDPLSGQVELFHDLATGANGFQPIAYDPWRDRLLFFGGFAPNTVELWSSDADGNLQSLGLQTTSGGARGLLTPRGDGLVYLLNPLAIDRLSYLDASDQVQPLLDAAGTAPWDFGIAEVNIQSLLYEPLTNSLLLTRWGFSTPCAAVGTNETSIHQLFLSADGTRVLSETCYAYDANPTDWDGETRGLSLAPDGEVLLVIGDGGAASGAQQRIATIDPVAGSASPFATTDFFAQHRIVGGTYSSILGKAVVHDSFLEALRAFGPGEVGEGTIIATGLSASPSSGEPAHLIEIASLAYPTGLTADVGELSLSGGGTQALTLSLGPTLAGGLYLLLGSASGWAPGLTVDGLILPLNADAYLSATITSPNQAPLSGSLGSLDGAGQAAAQFQVPPSSDPALVGVELHHAALVFGVTFAVDRTTNAVAVRLVP